MKERNFKETKKELEKLKEDNYRNYIKAILSIELNINKDEILENLYDEYMNNDEFYLLNDEFYIQYKMELDLNNKVEKNEKSKYIER